MGCIVCLSSLEFHQVLIFLGGVMGKFLSRLREPSTWAGLSALGILFGAPDGAVDAVGQIVGGVAALGAIVLAERK